MLFRLTMFSKSAVVLAVTLAAPAATLIADPALISGIQKADMDTRVRPQDDLFDYANGTWLRTVPIPADRSRYGVDTMMSERSLIQQRELIEREAVLHQRLAGDGCQAIGSGEGAGGLYAWIRNAGIE